MDRLRGRVTFMDHSRAFRARLAPLPTECMNRASGQPRHTIESNLAPLNTGLATACHQAQDRPTCIERCRRNGNIRQRRSHSMMTIMTLRPRGGGRGPRSKCPTFGGGEIRSICVGRRTSAVLPGTRLSGSVSATAAHRPVELSHGLSE